MSSAPAARTGSDWAELDWVQRNCIHSFASPPDNSAACFFVSLLCSALLCFALLHTHSISSELPSRIPSPVYPLCSRQAGPISQPNSPPEGRSCHCNIVSASQPANPASPVPASHSQRARTSIPQTHTHTHTNLELDTSHAVPVIFVRIPTSRDTPPSVHRRRLSPLLSPLLSHPRPLSVPPEVRLQLLGLLKSPEIIILPAPDPPNNRAPRPIAT